MQSMSGSLPGRRVLGVTDSRSPRATDAALESVSLWNIARSGMSEHGLVFPDGYLVATFEEPTGELEYLWDLWDDGLRGEAFDATLKAAVLKLGIEGVWFVRCTNVEVATPGLYVLVDSGKMEPVVYGPFVGVCGIVEAEEFLAQRWECDDEEDVRGVSEVWNYDTVAMLSAHRLRRTLSRGLERGVFPADELDALWAQAARDGVADLVGNILNDGGPVAWASWGR